MANASVVLAQVRDQLFDTGDVRWADAELLRYVSAGQRQIVALRPEANAVETLETLSSADVRHEIPSDGIKFIKATNNRNGADTARTGVIRFVEKDALDSMDPGWEYQAATVNPGSAESFFQHYTHDEREPRVYYLYPKPDASGKKVYIVYSKIPADVTAGGDALALSDIYIEPLVDYTVYRALTREGREKVSEARATELFANFLRSLGMIREAQRLVTPEYNRPPRQP